MPLFNLLAKIMYTICLVIGVTFSVILLGDRRDAVLDAAFKKKPSEIHPFN